MTPDGLAQLKRHEGLRLHAYPDPLTHAAPWTIGYGCTGQGIGPDTVWTRQRAEEECAAHVARCEMLLDDKLSWWRDLDAVRRDVLVEMAYNLGVDGLLGFRNTLAAVRSSDYLAAARGMLQSKWASQVKGRAEALAAQMRSGSRGPLA